MLFLGGNVEGDMRLKPLLVYHSKTMSPERMEASWVTMGIFRFHNKLLLSLCCILVFQYHFISPASGSRCIAIFKAYYLQFVMRYLVSDSGVESKPTVQELWK
jgi:hypothetical protein